MRFAHKMALTAFVAALLSSAAMASSALAVTPEWYAATTAEWQQGGVPLSEMSATKWKGSIRLTVDGGEQGAECEASGEGTAGPEGSGTLTALTGSKCTATKNCGSPTLKAEHLPWHAKLTLAEGKTQDVFTEDGDYEPAFSLDCTVIGIRANDLCLAPQITAGISNAGTGVDVTFNDSSVLYCDLYHNTKDVLEGTQLVEATKGGKLEVKAPLTKLTKSLETTTSGKMNLTNHGIVELKCEGSEFDGKIEGAGKGTISSAKLGGLCKGGSECSSPSAEPLHLPWDTELYTNESDGISDRIVSGGSGTPEFEVRCIDIGEEYKFICELNTNASLFNEGAGDVLAEFAEGISKETSCGATKAQWSGDLTIRPTNHDPLEVRG